MIRIGKTSGAMNELNAIFFKLPQNQFPLLFQNNVKTVVEIVDGNLFLFEIFTIETSLMEPRQI